MSPGAGTLLDTAVPAYVALPPDRSELGTEKGKENSMVLYLLKEIACCVLVAAALVVLIGAAVLVCKATWMATWKVVGGVRYAHARLAQARLSGVVPLGPRHASLTFPSVWRSGRASGERELASKTA